MIFRTITLAGAVCLCAVAFSESAHAELSRAARLKIRTQKYVPPPTIIGKTNSGVYLRGGDRILLVAAEFRGEFTHSAADRAFDRACDYLRDNNQTVAAGRYNRRLASDRHVVYGWYNVTRGEIGYVAFRSLGDGRSAEIVTNNGTTRIINDWRYESWTTNGYKVTIQIADDDRGGVAAIFHSIK
jgi:hypothetical protein